MQNKLRNLGIGVVAFAALLAAGAWGAWSWIVHRIEIRERAPHLEVMADAKPAPDMRFETLEGQERHVSDYRGKVVVLDLWGTWCIQCVAEMPSLQRMYDRYRHDPDVQFLIVSRMDTPQKVRSYARRGHFDLPFFVTEDSDIPESMQLHQFPSTFVIDKQGTLVSQHAGAADWSAPGVATFLDDLKKH